MKRIFVALALLAFLIPSLASAQLYTSVASRTSLDSTVGIRGRTITNGFGAYKYLSPSDLELKSYITRTLWAYQTGVTDSLKVQGAVVRTVYKTSSGVVRAVLDTMWNDVPLTWKITSKTGIDNRGAFAHDTTTYWLTPVGTDLTSWTADFSSAPTYCAYRVVTGINDSTTVKYRVQGRRGNQ